LKSSLSTSPAKALGQWVRPDIASSGTLNIPMGGSIALEASNIVFSANETGNESPISPLRYNEMGPEDVNKRRFGKGGFAGYIGSTNNNTNTNSRESNDD
jgi:hypothetical protein